MTTYKKVTDVEHILLRPDTYVGSKEPRSVKEYILSESLEVLQQEVTKSPAIERTFTEILSNAVDNTLRHKLDPENVQATKSIKVTMNQETGEVSIWNDGAFIPISKDNKEGIYNHSLIFGHLRSSSNYDDDQVRFVSGRNGFGAKLTNVFSTLFEVTAVDPERKLKLVQTWSKNMSTTSTPSVTKSTIKTGSTLIRWRLDFSQFKCGAQAYTQDYANLFRMHALNAAITTGTSVTFNGVKLPNNLSKYCDLVLKAPQSLKVTSSDSVAIIAPGSEFEQLSFVNGIRTRAGGRHVDTWMQSLCKALINQMGMTRELSGTRPLTVKDIKQHLRILLISTLPNPEFDSQEKNRLEAPGVTTPPFTDQVLKKILNTWGLKKAIQDSHLARETVKAIKTISEPRKIIPGYDKANHCDSPKYASQCTLFICEGLSAKTFAVMGLTHGMKVAPDEPLRKGRDWFGIYPLRGKILNVRKVSLTTLSKNEIMCNLMHILGLSLNAGKQRRAKYGHVCILTDADTDGTHIKGLLVNFFAMYFPTMMLNVVSMNTPILRINNLYVYDERSDKKKLITGAIKSTKYYKGLGTSEKKDIKETFGAKMTLYEVTEDTNEYLNLAFGKNETQARKDWIEQYQPYTVRTDTIDFHKGQFYTQSLVDFVKDDLINFARADCVRSLPSIMDGLKESQRKVLFAAKKKNFTQEYKVTQFAGYVSENSEYHHGEQNLLDTIIRMAQDFPGANNCPVFMSEASFGSRLEGGKDAAQGRYLMTRLRPYVNLLFPSEDDKLLSYKAEGNLAIEPYYYMPIMPTILLNGCKGIGTGWSCSIPCFLVKDVLDNTRRWIQKQPLVAMLPSYPGFKGTITPLKANSLSDLDMTYEVKGVYTVEGGTNVTVTELPIGLWTSKFITWCQEQPITFKDYSDVNTVRVELKAPKGYDLGGLDKVLTVNISLRNVVTFDRNEVITRVTLQDIFDQWGQERLALYKKRKAHLVSELTAKLQDQKLTIAVIKLVQEKKVNLFDSESKVEKDLGAALEGGYDLGKALDKLLVLPVRSFTAEKVKKVADMIASLTKDLAQLQKTTATQLWTRDLERFEGAYDL